MSDEVVCLGSAIVDVLVRVDDDFITTAGLDKGAMRLVEADEAKRLYAALTDAVEQSGGGAANTAAIIAKLGGGVTFIGRVADDALGAAFTHDIRRVGVTFDPRPAPALPSTAHCTILVSPDGERTMNTYLGACSEMSPHDVDTATVAAAELLYCEGFLWDAPSCRDAALAAIDAAKASGTRVALALNDQYCVDRHRAEFLELLAGPVDLVFGNETEVRAVFETDDLEDAGRRLGELCPLVATTRSEKGSVLYVKGERVAVPGVPVDQVVDTTGAGDAYAGGFLYGLTHGYEPEQCAALGSACASETIRHIGARPAADLTTLL
ncbi:MAG TPA: adenosine kinase [Acidimicrobiales bacterium]|nr:adenosine kinase [Acidimicrobiales bacterium]